MNMLTINERKGTSEKSAYQTLIELNTHINSKKLPGYRAHRTQCKTYAINCSGNNTMALSTANALIQPIISLWYIIDSRRCGAEKIR